MPTLLCNQFQLEARGERGRSAAAAVRAAAGLRRRAGGGDAGAHRGLHVRQGALRQRHLAGGAGKATSY